MDLLKLENAELWFKNFSGEPGKFNKDGVRSFNVAIRDHEKAEQLIADGWNLRARVVDDEDPYYLLQVAVMFGNYPPDIYQISGNKKIRLDEDTVGNLDHVEIECADVIIRPYEWEVNGKTGVKAYLKTMYVIIEEDDFAAKYADYENN